MKNVLKSLFVAIVAMSVTFAYAQNDGAKKTDKKMDKKEKTTKKDAKKAPKKSKKKATKETTPSK